MQKYGYQFEPVPSRPGWFTARDVEGDAAERAARRVHAEFELGSDLVFCGLPPDGGADRLFLLESGDPARVARDFGVGSQAECYDQEAAVETFAEVEFPGAIKTGCGAHFHHGHFLAIPELVIYA